MILECLKRALKSKRQHQEKRPSFGGVYIGPTRSETVKKSVKKSSFGKKGRRRSRPKLTRRKTRSIDDSNGGLIGKTPSEDSLDGDGRLESTEIWLTRFVL